MSLTKAIIVRLRRMEGFMKILMVIALLLLLCGSSGWTVNADPGLLSASTATSAGASSVRPASAGGAPSIIMADAARTCATVEDFERFLTRNLLACYHPGGRAGNPAAGRGITQEKPLGVGVGCL
jgi:hypothetical protein